MLGAMRELVRAEQRLVFIKVVCTAPASGMFGKRGKCLTGKRWIQ